jgi:transcriptional regulator with XRE-family HTH domain
MAGVPYAALGAGLRAARAAAHRPQTWLAARLGVAQAVVSHYEHGRTRPRPERLAVYAAVLGVDPAELVALAGYPAPPAAR